MKETHHLKNRPAFFTTPGNSRMKVGVTCSKCGAQEIGSDRPGLPPELISKHFAANGWKVYREGVSATCPACQKAGADAKPEDDGAASLARQEAAELRRQAAMPKLGEKFSSALAAVATRITPTPAPATTEPMTTQTATIPASATASQNAYRAQAIMHRLLGEHFTAEGDIGAYDEGWSDARISNEAGLALAEVTRVREAAYGKILDPRLAKIEAAINQAAAKLARDTAELATMLEQVKAEGAKAIGDLQRQLAEVRSRP